MHRDTLDLDLTLPELAVSWEPVWALPSLPQPLQVWEVERLHRHGSLQSGSMSPHARPSELVRAPCRGRGNIRGKKELWEARVLQGKPELVSHFCFFLRAYRALPLIPSCFWLRPSSLLGIPDMHPRHSLGLPLLWVPLKSCLCKKHLASGEPVGVVGGQHVWPMSIRVVKP